jgi:hypothetical protein
VSCFGHQLKALGHRLVYLNWHRVDPFVPRRDSSFDDWPARENSEGNAFLYYDLKNFTERYWGLMVVTIMASYGAYL